MAPVPQIPLCCTALLCIDIQSGVQTPYFGPVRSTPSFETTIPRILSAFRSKSPQVHILHAQHHSTNKSSPLHPSSPGHAHAPYATPLLHERVFPKNVNSAFIGTDLEAYLRNYEIKRLVVIGLVTDHCVGTTVRMAANLGIVKEGDYADESVEDAGEILVVREGTAAFAKGGFGAEEVQSVELACLDGEFCRVVGVEGVLRELEGWE